MKIFTTTLAYRIKLILPLYVHKDQMGFIPGRDIADNVRRTLDLLYFGRKHHVPSILVALDVEKAFNTVGVPYMIALLTEMGFGIGFLRVIKSFYSFSTSNLLISGLWSGNIMLQIGTRQGCPLSPLLFALCMEPIAQKI